MGGRGLTLLAWGVGTKQLSTGRVDITVKRNYTILSLLTDHNGNYELWHLYKRNMPTRDHLARARDHLECAVAHWQEFSNRKLLDVLIPSQLKVSILNTGKNSPIYEHVYDS